MNVTSMVPFDVGHIRWSSLTAAASERCCEEPSLKLPRCEATVAPLVRMLGNHVASDNDDGVLSTLERLRQHIVLHATRTVQSNDNDDVSFQTAPLFAILQGNALRVSFVDFSTTQVQLSVPHLPLSGRLPPLVQIGEETAVHIVLEERTAQCATTVGGTPSHRETLTAPPAQGPHPRVLMIGAGGIGCELVKCITLCGIRSVTIVDLDTIDATNLNRQFLFRREHIDMSKSAVAAMVMNARISSDNADEAATGRNDHQQQGSMGSAMSIRSICGNVKDNGLDVSFYKAFDIVLNGLDNMSARKHVNRMCMVAGVPMIESGTMGFNGQVQPIVKGLTECYDCRPKPADQPTFAVCTIHARPTSMVHCVHYAKELYDRMMSVGRTNVPADAPSEGSDPLPPTSASEVDAAAALFSAASNVSIAACATDLFKLLFVDKIESLVALHVDNNHWPSGNAPAPLLDVWNGLLNESQSGAMPVSPQDIATLRGGLLVAEGRVPSTKDNALLFVDSFRRLVQRHHWSNNNEKECTVSFSKDDDDAVVFVSTVANLRATCFHIPAKGLEELRSIAGNIVPAIASSNAIVAACVASQALAFLQASGPAWPARSATAATKNIDAGRFVYLRKVPLYRRRRRNGGSRAAARLLLHTCPLEKPNENCIVCAHHHVTRHVCLNASLHTVRSLVDVVLKGHYAVVSPCLSLGSRIIFEEEEFETLASRPLMVFFDAPLNLVPLRATFVASDLHQQLEWSLCVQHDASLEDEISFSVDGVVFGSSEAESAT